MTTASTQRGTQWSSRVIQGALLPALYQAWPTPQESCSKAFWKPHAADSGLFEARWGQALASCPQARAATRKNVKVLCAPAWGSGGWEPVTGRVGLAFCPQQVRGGEGRHFSCDFAFFPAFLISIYLRLGLVFVSSGLFLLCKLLVWFRDTRSASLWRGAPHGQAAMAHLGGGVHLAVLNDQSTSEAQSSVLLSAFSSVYRKKPALFGPPTSRPAVWPGHTYQFHHCNDRMTQTASVK